MPVVSRIYGTNFIGANAPIKLIVCAGRIGIAIQDTSALPYGPAKTFEDCIGRLMFKEKLTQKLAGC